MLFFIIKVISSALIIGIISEVSKRSTFIGSIFASIPLTSILAIIWLYEEKKNLSQIISLSYNIFWLVIPSLSFFLIFPYFLKINLNFYFALLLSISIMLLFYFLMVLILGIFGYKM